MHFFLLGFVLFLLLTHSCVTETSGGEASDRILYGFSANIISYPYQVGLLTTIRTHGNSHKLGCGGSIISETFILTAAHCVIPPDLTYDPVTADGVLVHANRSILNKANQGDQVVHVKNIIFHPHADIALRRTARRGCRDNDVAILELTNPLTLGPGIQVIPLAKANTTLPINTEAEISGYGAISDARMESSNVAGQLYAAAVKIADATLCKQCYGYYMRSKNYICAGKVKHTPGILIGDSGGPLVVRGVLEGVTSCSVPNNFCPDMFVQVANNDVRAFIQRVTGI